MKKLIYTVVMVLALVVMQDAFAKAGYKTTGVVNINTATKAELVMIPGIGDAKAEAILSQRAGKGFSHKDDLLAVKGIGKKLLTRIAPFIVTEGKTTIKTVKLSSETPNKNNSVK